MKLALTKGGVEFEEKNLPDHPDVLAGFIARGFGSAPIVEAPGVETFAGYNPYLAKEIIALHGVGR